MLGHVRDALMAQGVATEIVCAAAFNSLPGVRSDEGPGDEWPALRAKVLAAYILVIGSPIRVGQPSSVAKRVSAWMRSCPKPTTAAACLPTAGSDNHRGSARCWVIGHRGEARIQSPTCPARDRRIG